MKMVFCDLCGTQITEKEPTFRLTISAEGIYPLSGWYDMASLGAWRDNYSGISYHPWVPVSELSTSLTLEVCKDCRDKIKPFLDGLKEALQKLVRE